MTHHMATTQAGIPVQNRSQKVIGLDVAFHE